MNILKRLLLALFAAAISSAYGQKITICGPRVTIDYSPGSASRVWGGFLGFDTTLDPRTHWLRHEDVTEEQKNVDGSYNMTAVRTAISICEKQEVSPSQDYTINFLTKSDPGMSPTHCSSTATNEWPTDCTGDFSVSYFNTEGPILAETYGQNYTLGSGSDVFNPLQYSGLDALSYGGHTWASAVQEGERLINQYTLDQFLSDLFTDLLLSFGSSTVWTTQPQKGVFHYTGTARPTDSAYESAFYYRFRIPTEEKVPYKLTWEEVHRYPAKNPMIIRHSAIVDASASDGEDAMSETYFAAPESGVESTVTIRFISAESVEAPGGLAIGCRICGPVMPERRLSYTGLIQGPYMRMDMGRADYGQWAGDFSYEYNPLLHTNPITSPFHLSFTGPFSGRTVVTKNPEGAITNVVTEQMEADVKSVDSITYNVNFYLRTNNARIGSTPWTVWTITASGTNAMYINETHGGSTVTNFFTYSATTNSWVGILGNGLRKEHWKAVGYAPDYQETFEVYDGTGTTLLSRDVISLGEIPNEMIGITSEQNGDDNPTEYEYDGDSNLLLVVYPDESWNVFLDYDGLYPMTVWSPFINSSYSQSWGHHRVTTLNSITQNSAIDDKTVLSNSLRYVKQSVSGTTVEQSFRILSTNRIEYRRGQDSSATAIASDDLITVVTNYSSGAFKREPYTIEHENGVVEVFYYTTNSTSKTTTRFAGEHDGVFTNIVKGTRTVTQVGIAGELMAETVYSIPGDYQIFSKTVTDADSLRRPVRVVYMDGTFEGYSYDCCGIAAKTNRDGSVISYVYDALKRKYSETQEGVSLIYGYDAVGQLLSLTRLGTNGNSHPVFTRGFTLEGRLLAETNALGEYVTFSQSTNMYNETTRTATFMNGATWSERTALDGSLQEVSGTAAPPIKFYYGVESTGDTGTNGPADAYYTKVVRLDSDGGDSEWTQTYSDMLGRNYKRTFAAAWGQPIPMERLWFNPKGQLARATDADSVNWLFLYNKRGELEFEVQDLDRDNVVGWDGTDRIRQWTNEVTSVSGTPLIRLHQYAWDTNGYNGSNLVSTLEMTGDWLTARRILWNGSTGVTNSLVRTIGSGGLQQLKLVQPWGENFYAEFTRGRLQAVTRRGSSNSQLEKRSFSYDKYGRLRLETDARDGTSTLEYDDADQLISFASPTPGTGGAAQVLSNYFNNMGWLIGQRLPDGSGWTNFYTLRGELQSSYGSLSYPVEYSYDAQGRLKRLKTWQDFAGNSGIATTTWNYDIYRGFLAGKLYGSSAGPTYTYTKAGRLASRTWARGTNTVYGYDYGGRLNSITYDDGGTPGVSRTLDRRGRTKTITQNSIVTSFDYGSAGQRLAESYSGGLLGGLAVTNNYDGFLRRSSTIAAGFGGTLNGYTYDSTSGKLATVGDGTNVATYSYLANSALSTQILFKQSGTTRLTTVKAYDFLDRMSSILSTPSGANMGPSSLSYLYNDLNERKREVAGDGSAWIYNYDSIGQLTSGKKAWGDGTPVEGEQFEYAYDDIGNRKSTKEGGNATGQNLRSATYTANSLNQYTTRSVPDKVNILGLSTSASTVQVNGSNADYRRGPYFRKELSVSNTGTNAIWQSVTVTASPDTITGNLFIPGATQNFSYDADGNLTNDYTWAYIYNGENQLTEIRPLTNSPAASKKWLTFTYDYAGRRIQKTAATWDGSAWSLTTSNRFLYDRWNLIAELNATNNALIRGYIWGADISGTLQGAGGVGGLLAINDPANGAQFVSYDGKGNVIALVSAATGAYTAQYEYDPYGRVLRATGPMAAKNPFHFSGKYEDMEAGLVYYGYRYYNPSLGRWQNRDPIEEWGGFNIYGFVYNETPDLIDTDGRFILSTLFLYHDTSNLIKEPSLLNGLLVVADALALIADIPTGGVGGEMAQVAFGGARAISLADKAIEAIDAARWIDRGDVSILGIQEFVHAMTSGEKDRKLINDADSSSGSSSNKKPDKNAFSKCLLRPPVDSQLKEGHSQALGRIPGGSGHAFTGHGSWDGFSFTTVPPGTYFNTYADLGKGISQFLGRDIERGNIEAALKYSEAEGAMSYGPGMRVPDLILYQPESLFIFENTMTVRQPTPLSELLKPNMGQVDWAGCLFCR